MRAVREIAPVLAAVAAAGLLAGCGGDRPAPVVALARAAAVQAASPTGTPTGTGPGTGVGTGTAAGGWPPFASSAGPVTAARLGGSWRPGCPVGADGLRLLRLRYAGFDGAAHDGELVVAARLAGEVTAVFAELYRVRFPIRQMRTMDRFGGSDSASMAADNTSAFDCRRVTGGTAWSAHAYGRAIDVNPRENPYRSGRVVLPPDARRDRSRAAPGTVTPAVVAAFARQGWSWGGTWAGPVDYQHFQRG